MNKIEAIQYVIDEAKKDRPSTNMVVLKERLNKLDEDAAIRFADIVAKYGLDSLLSMFGK